MAFGRHGDAPLHGQTVLALYHCLGQKPADADKVARAYLGAIIHAMKHRRPQYSTFVNTNPCAGATGAQAWRSRASSIA